MPQNRRAPASPSPAHHDARSSAPPAARRSFDAHTNRVDTGRPARPCPCRCRRSASPQNQRLPWLRLILAVLNEIPTITVQVFEHCDQAVGLLARRPNESNAAVEHFAVVAPGGGG